MNSAESAVVPLRDPEREREQRVVDRARDGDMAAFEELYRRHAGRVYAVCLRLVRDPARAEDLSQEAFVRAWRGLKGFRGESRLSSWLHRIAVNVALRDLRRNSRHETELDESAHAAPGRSDNSARWDLERAIQSLPDRARTVFVLHDIEGYSHEEVGKLAGMATGTSKAQLHRARKLLRGSLAG
ncbi:MAG: sigma-70 family RNA polymerase sigma factor [Gammaproteobacteria bacterium]|nr:MAG: sigma-70 family RNA polymerase sigma factor [Gammaproteobacteria bacterium]